ncbi:hypothetical protein C8Q77DRAFT_1066335, partial [Trametes polyzona]
RFVGGLSSEDLINMAPVSPSSSLGFTHVVEEELKETLVAIADFYSAGDDEGDSAEGQDQDHLHAASRLPQQIRFQRETIVKQRERLQESRTHVLELVEQLNTAEPALQSQLRSAFETLPPQLRAARTAEADVLAATIEAALLKLSLVRVRAHRALYGFSQQSSSAATSGASASTSSRRATVAQAVTAAHEALLSRQRAQEEEMRTLDGQISVYEGMLGLVEGGGGAFAQVVSDMARVKRETEECRRDLRRLGWTGD